MDHGIPSIRQDGWVEAEATITSCKQTLLSSIQGQSLTPGEFFQVPEYTVEFRYAVGRETFTDKYRAHSEQVVGSTLTIAYDPVKPQRNTGADPIQNPWIRIVAWSVGVGLAALAIWLGFSDVQPF